MDTGDLSEGMSAAHYCATAARARRIQGETTTPGLKEHLRKFIAECERLAAEASSASQRGRAGNSLALEIP